MASDFKACCVDSCKRDARHSKGGARGMCSKHYLRFRKHGDCTVVSVTPKSDISAFLENVALSSREETCIEWPYARNNTGYGVRGSEYVHRLVCEKMHGPPPTKKHQAAHSCGNRLCVNWRHIRWATPSENQRDRIAHGTHLRGSRSNFAKLNESQVREILLAKGKDSRKSLAEKHNTTVANITSIHLRYSWAWITI